MKSKIQSNGLSVRTNRCLSKAGVSIDKESIARALKSGRLYPYHWPPNYGRKTHDEVCRWAKIDPTSLSAPGVQSAVMDLDNGLSYRANRCLARAHISATKHLVRHALLTGKLWPGKHPGNYGRQTHAELCRWAGVDPARLASSSKIYLGGASAKHA